jgi:hypothetical protein
MRAYAVARAVHGSAPEYEVINNSTRGAADSRERGADASVCREHRAKH